MYEKQYWENGDLITAEKFNNIENGIETNACFIINVNSEGQNLILDKTYKEIVTAINNKILPRIRCIIDQDQIYFLLIDYVEPYKISINGIIWVASAENDYPITEKTALGGK